MTSKKDAVILISFYLLKNFKFFDFRGYLFGFLRDNQLPIYDGLLVSALKIFQFFLHL